MDLLINRKLIKFYLDYDFNIPEMVLDWDVFLS